MNAVTQVPSASGTVALNHNAPVQLPKLTDAQKEAIDKGMRALADKLASVVDEEVNALVISIEHSKKEVATGPFRIMRWAMDHINTDTLALFPNPGSDTGDCPDKYEEVYFRDGKKKFRATSFYLKWFLNTFPEGQRIAAALAHIALAKDEKANQAAVPQEIRNLDPVALEALREDLVSKQNSGVKAVRDTFALIKQFDAVNALKGVTAEPLLDKDGNVEKMQKPIHVYNVDQPKKEWGLYSISGFMQFDPAKAAEMGGTFDQLKLTAKREQGEEEGDPATSDAPVAINTNKTLVARLGDIHEFINNKLMADPKREAYGLFLREHIAVAGSNDLIETLDDIRTFCAKILAIPSVAGRLEDIVNGRAAKAV